MDCRVVVEAAVPVYDIETADEAVRIAISKTGKMINPDLNYVEIELSDRAAPGEDNPAFVVAGAALVALDFEMDVFNVDREEHASRIAHTEIGDRLVDIPLEVVAIEELDEENAGRETDEPNASDDVEADAATPAVSDTGQDTDASASNEASADADDGADVLPPFEDLLEE